MLNHIGNLCGVFVGLTLCVISLVGIYQIMTSKEEDTP